MNSMKPYTRTAVAAALIGGSALGVAAAQQGPDLLRQETKLGSDGINVIRGTNSADVIVTKDGDDTVYGLRGRIESARDKARTTSTAAGSID